MIRLGLRLTVGGGRQAAARLAVTASAVAIGVGLLLVTLAGINAIGAQNQRAAWLATGSAPAAHGNTPAPTAAPDADPLWWLVTTGRFGTQVIYRVDVAATGPRSPIPPGIPRLPGPGQYYASPALSTLLRSTPAAELGDRFGGKRVLLWALAVHPRRFRGLLGANLAAAVGFWFLYVWALPAVVLSVKVVVPARGPCRLASPVRK